MFLDNSRDDASVQGRPVVVFGGGGQLARELTPALARRGWRVHSISRNECDITDEAAVAAMLDRHEPALVINCAAFTLVDRAEREPEKAFAVNAAGAGNVARASAPRGSTLVHISTDYVFNGLKSTPYSECDTPAPLGVYGQSKYEGEKEVFAAGGRTYVVRTGELYGDGGRNFFHMVLRRAREGLPLRVVDDQFVTPTWTREFAEQLVTIVHEAPPGLYHATAQGETSWFDAACTMLAVTGVNARIEPVSTEEFGSSTPRPRYTVLAHQVLEQLGIYRMRPWEESLARWAGRSHGMNAHGKP